MDRAVRPTADLAPEFQAFLESVPCTSADAQSVVYGEYVDTQEDPRFIFFLDEHADTPFGQQDFTDAAYLESLLEELVVLATTTCVS